MPAFKYRDGRLPNLLALSYVALGIPLAIIGLFSPLFCLPAVLLLAHVWVIAAYLLHDCAHNSVFRENRHNAQLGTLLSWLTGACYLPYAMLREKHFRHHLERVDVVAVDYHLLITSHPLTKKLVSTLAFVNFPAVELLSHGCAMAAPFMLDELKSLRGRTLRVIVIRLALLLLLCSLSLQALLAYALAYILFISVMGFMDAFQHDYGLSYHLLESRQPAAHDEAYEQSHTYSNLLSSRRPWVNLLVLNFCYHNVHHQKPNEPWYRLPAIHGNTYADGCTQLVSLPAQLQRFFRYRINRATRSGDSRVTGADGVSFLVGV